ncbi:MAG TPA: hypothetical protein VN493_13920 [Thermoanaerobaculia bacterium]|nr:hypothetical protein [Thermoanaerobaculia bacterium]
MSTVYLYMNRVNGWDQVVAGVNANAEEAPELVPGVPRLETLSSQARSLNQQYAALRASKQELARQIEAVLRRGTPWPTS